MYRIKGYAGQTGRPQVLNRQKLIRMIRQLCRARYVKNSQFPPALYKSCRAYFGSVRAAKWEAGVVDDKRWNYDQFIRRVRQFCKGHYQENTRWPHHLRELARRYCGSIRAAKWEAGVIEDPRRGKRKVPTLLKGKWTKEKFLKWVKRFTKKRGQKVQFWPSYMRLLAVRYYHSIRGAKLASGVLPEPRKKRR